MSWGWGSFPFFQFGLSAPRHCREFPQRGAHLVIFYRETHHNRNRIVTAKKENGFLAFGQACGHHLQLFNADGLTPKRSKNPWRTVSTFEAQQRYFSYRAILVAIVSQNSFVLVFMGYRTIIAQYVAKWGIARMCLCKIKYTGGYRTFLGER